VSVVDAVMVSGREEELVDSVRLMPFYISVSPLYAWECICSTEIRRSEWLEASSILAVKKGLAQVYSLP
jgi:hypothetical protein